MEVQLSQNRPVLSLQNYEAAVEQSLFELGSSEPEVQQFLKSVGYSFLKYHGSNLVELVKAGISLEILNSYSPDFKQTLVMRRDFELFCASIGSLIKSGVSPQDSVEFVHSLKSHLSSADISKIAKLVKVGLSFNAFKELSFEDQSAILSPLNMNRVELCENLGIRCDFLFEIPKTYAEQFTLDRRCENILKYSSLLKREEVSFRLFEHCIFERPDKLEMVSSFLSSEHLEEGEMSSELLDHCIMERPDKLEMINYFLEKTGMAKKRIWSLIQDESEQWTKSYLYFSKKLITFGLSPEERQVCLSLRCYVHGRSDPELDQKLKICTIAALGAAKASPYLILGVTKGSLAATRGTVESRDLHKSLFLKYHPDKNRGDEESATKAFQAIEMAFDSLPFKFVDSEGMT